ncbi:lysophospholipid acyltransferase family protein [Propionibacteriaceae bacterium Y1700]|uniref:lysophospholipid acyltransferase family protein n=1 Tax=Microlunatus sp. Y1700 TaxID=3418487 RepID=UPI003DA6CE78
MSRTSRYSSPLHAAARYVTQRLLLKPVAWSSVTMSVEGTERLKGLKPPYVVVANHSSHLDATAIVCAIPWKVGGNLATGAAADYFFTKWHRKVFTALLFNAFPIERSGVRNKKSVAATLLSENVPILLFPEGTRSYTGAMATFKPGAAALSINQGIPVVPVAVVGAHEAMPRGRSWPKPGRPPVRLVFGAPMEAEPGETPVAFSARLAQAVRDLFDPVADEMGILRIDDRPPSVKPGRSRDTLTPGSGADSSTDDNGDAGDSQSIENDDATHSGDDQ